MNEEPALNTRGRHLLLELRGCDPSLLDDLSTVRELMESAATAARASIVDSVFHRYSPQGVTGVVVIEESHLSIHTWPEHAYAAVDLYTCGECDSHAAMDVLTESFAAERSEWMLSERGLDRSRGASAIADHARTQAPVARVAGA